MKKLFAILAAAVAAFAVAQTPPSSLPNQFGPTVVWRTIAIGDGSAITQPEAKMISSQRSWEKYYRAMAGVPEGEKINIPNVADWQNEDVMVIHVGQRSNAGHSVYVETIERTMSHYYDIKVVVQEPPRGAMTAQVMISPYVVIAIKKTTGTPRVFYRTSTQSTYVISGGCGCGSKPIIMVGAGGKVIPLGETGGKCSKCGKEISNGSPPGNGRNSGNN